MFSRSNPLGALFSEEIVQERKMRKIPKNFSEEDTFSYKRRLLLFIFMLVFALGILLMRVFTLTVVEGKMYRQAALDNRIRESKIVAPRGIIYDRKRTALVRNIPVSILPATTSAYPVESVAREYIYASLTSHVLGYTGEVESQELEKNKKNGLPGALYKLGDIVGKTGIEKVYDSVLRGIDGKELVEVDALGNTVRSLGKVEPKPGENIDLSLDINLQRAASEGLSGKKGAVVAQDPFTGEILALFSSPSFDANKFIRGEGLEEVFTDTDKPLFNRAVSGEYPPGSTFKIVTALAALEEGVIKKDTQFEDVGVLKVGNFSYSNWYFTQHGKKEGMVDVVKALRRSNDIFFYKTGEALGIEKLADWGRKMGIGKTLGIDIPGEVGGLMPDPVWQKKIKGEDWYLGNTYHVSIGQGDVLVTPLQVNAWTNIIASGGRLCRPHLVKSQVLTSRTQDYCRDLIIKKESIELVREGMRQACAPGGTGWPLFRFKVQSGSLKIDGVDFLRYQEATPSGKNWVEIPVACKTGTAEFGDPHGKTHAWFTVFAPVHKPQISITVLVEQGGEGSSVAAPIAKKILEEWFK